MDGIGVQLPYYYHDTSSMLTWFVKNVLVKTFKDPVYREWLIILKSRIMSYTEPCQ